LNFGQLYIWLPFSAPLGEALPSFQPVNQRLGSRKPDTAHASTSRPATHSGQMIVQARVLASSFLFSWPLTHDFQFRKE